MKTVVPPDVLESKPPENKQKPPNQANGTTEKIVTPPKLQNPVFPLASVG